MFLYLLLFVSIAAATHVPMSTVVRPEYGVAFMAQSVVDNSRSVWHHTFVYTMKRRNLLPYSRLCNGRMTPTPGRVTEANFCPSLIVYNKRIEELARDVQNLMDDIKLLMPSSPTRQKRGLIDLVGRAAKFLFGLSTEKDNEIMSKQIHMIKRDSKLTHRDVIIMAKHFRSFSGDLTKRTELLEKAVLASRSDLVDYVNQAITNFTRRSENTVDWINVLHVYALQYVDSLTDLRHKLTQELHMIQTLLEGYLPVEMVSPQTLRDTLEDIQERGDFATTFQFALTDLSAYYKMQDILYTVTRDQLFVTLKIPITSTTTVYTVYRIQAVPIRISNERNETSVIELKDPYLAVSSDKMFYFTMSESQFQSCQGNLFKRCDQGLAVKETTHMTCSMAIFLNDHSQIKELCEFTLLLNDNEIDTQILSLDTNTYLLSTFDLIWIQSCPGGTPVHVEPCMLCVIKLPCTCSLKAKTFYIPGTQENCHDLKFPITNVTHNLPAISSFYSKKQNMEEITAFLTDHADFQPDFPPIKLKEAEFDNIMKESRQVKLSLKKTALALENNEPLYVDEVSKLTDQLGYMSHPTVNTGIQILSMITLIGSVAALTISIRNLYVLTWIVQPAQAFPWEIPVTMPRTDDVDCHDRSQMWLSMTFVAFGCTCGAMCVVAFILWKQSKPLKRADILSCLKVVFISEQETISIPLKYLSVNVGDLYIETDEKCIVPKLKLSCFRYILSFDWSFIEISLSESKATVPLPTVVPVSFDQARHLEKVLASLTDLELTIVTGDQVFTIRTWSAVSITKSTAVTYKSYNGDDDFVEQVYISPING